MLKTIRSALRSWVLKDILLAVAETDMLDISSMSREEKSLYVRKARRVWTNQAFLAEVTRLKFVEERRMLTEAKSNADMEFGRAVLYTLDLLTKRFQSLASLADAEEAPGVRTEEGY